MTNGFRNKSNPKDRFMSKVMEKISYEESKFNTSAYITELKQYLTERQIEILELKVKGHENIYIADKLGVSPATITQEFKKIRETLEEEGYYGDTETD